ncbi:MAG: phospholipid carrier-dependent glycosyltransferase [Armatimonadetes bacterium]|nr:phospholipid carrier-dependent glycosyltransferase [Armatimonadota bacterium]
MTGVAIAALITMAAHNLGAALLAAAPGVALGAPDRRLVLRCGVGLGALAYVVLAIGLVGGLSPVVGWLLVGLALAAGLPALRRARPAQPDPVAMTLIVHHPGAVDGDDTWPRLADWLIGAALAIVALFALLTALAPPAGYDELTYHLAAPKIFARTGWVTILPYDHHTAFAFTLQMLYTLALLIGNAAAAKLIGLTLAVLSLVALNVVAREWFGRRVGRLALVIVAFTPLVITHAPLAYTEFGLMFWTLLALLSCGQYLNLSGDAVSTAGQGLRAAARQPRWLVLTGVFAGLCCGVKVTAALLVVVLAGAVLVLGRRDGLRTLRHALVLLSVCALVAAPWPIRSYLATGNPIFPFAHGAFPSPQWSIDRAQAYDTAQKEFGRALDERALTPIEPAGSQRSLARLLTAPWNATFHPTWFFDVGLNFDGKARLGPAYLALGLPFLALWVLLLGRRRRGIGLPGVSEEREETVEERYSPEFGRDVAMARPTAIVETTTVDTARALGLLLAIALVNGLFWFATMQYLRYLAPMLAVYGLLAAWAADNLLRLRLSAVAVVLVLTMQVAGGVAYSLTSGYYPLRVALGSLDRDRYAAASVHAYDAMQWLNAHRPSGKVALYGEPRGYWLDVDYLWGERNHHTLIPDSARTDGDTYLDFLSQRLGVSHILINGEVLRLDHTEGNDDVALLTQGVRQGRLHVAYEDARRPITVYEIGPRP